MYGCDIHARLSVTLGFRRSLGREYTAELEICHMVRVGQTSADTVPEVQKEGHFAFETHQRRWSNLELLRERPSKHPAFSGLVTTGKTVI